MIGCRSPGAEIRRVCVTDAAASTAATTTSDECNPVPDGVVPLPCSEREVSVGGADCALGAAVGVDDIAAPAKKRSNRRRTAAGVVPSASANN